MTKLTHKVFRPITALMHGVFGRWWLAHVARKTLDHDPNARADGYFAHQPSPGLFGVLVSNRISRD
jgi:hypothetical protein